MTQQTEILFGRIAIELDFVTIEDVEECLRIQNKLPEHMPLGEIMLERDYISEDQLNEIVEYQREKREKEGKVTRRMREDQKFGELVVDFGYATKEKVNEAQEIQDQRLEQQNEYFPLGHLLVEEEYITTRQFRTIQEYQENSILQCPECSYRINVVQYTPGTQLTCYNCNEGTVTVPDLDMSDETSEN